MKARETHFNKTPWLISEVNLVLKVPGWPMQGSFPQLRDEVKCSVQGWQCSGAIFSTDLLMDCSIHESSCFLRERSDHGTLTDSEVRAYFAKQFHAGYKIFYHFHYLQHAPTQRWETPNAGLLATSKLSSLRILWVLKPVKLPASILFHLGWHPALQSSSCPAAFVSLARGGGYWWEGKLCACLVLGLDDCRPVRQAVLSHGPNCSYGHGHRSLYPPSYPKM